MERDRIDSTKRSVPWRYAPVDSLLIVVPVAIIVAVIQSSFFEWTFHRYWLHRPWRPKECFTQHTLIHHQLCKFDDTFHVSEKEQHEALSFMWWGGPVLIAINVLPWALLAGVLRISGVSVPDGPFLVTFAAGMALYYAGYEGTHFLMHKPTIGWIERSRPFQFIKRHHRIHHVRMNRNFNVLLPLADIVLGTLALEMPPATPTPKSARELARRHSKSRRRAPAPAMARIDEAAVAPEGATSPDAP